MVFKTAAPPLAGEFPEVPKDIPRDQYDRPLIDQPDGTRLAYTRASTLGKTLEDDYNLSRWGERNVAIGMSRRKDLVALAASIATNEGDDRKPLQEVVDKAKEAAKGDAGANIGTALHRLSERRDIGEDLSYLPAILLDAVEAYARLMTRFHVLASETFVVHDEWQAAGTFDRVVSPSGQMTAPDGTTFGPNDALVLDLKTNKESKYFGPTYMVQQAIYGRGQPYRPGTGRIPWAQVLGDLGPAPSQQWALILHVPSVAPADAGLHWVDLTAGAQYAAMSLDVREARRQAKRAFTPALPPSPPAQVLKLGLISLLRAAANREALDTLYDQNVTVWDEDCTRMARTRLVELEQMAPAS